MQQKDNNKQKKSENAHFLAVDPIDLKDIKIGLQSGIDLKEIEMGLLSGDVDVNKTRFFSIPLFGSTLTLVETTPLSLAAFLGNIRFAQLCLDYGANVNPEINSPPLFVAVLKNKIEMVNFLLDHGANIDKETEVENSVYKAANADKSDCEVEIPKTFKITPLAAACDNDKYLELVNVLIKRGANLNGSPFRACPLNQAAQEGALKIVQLLLDHHANINQQALNGVTALANAIDAKKSEVVKLLIERGANPNIADKHGRTPLMIAAIRGDLSSVQLLLDHNADVNAVSENKMTALLYAAKNGNLNIVTELWKRGANHNVRDSSGFSLLHTAVICENIDLVKYLIANKCDVNAIDNDGWSVLMCAVKIGNTEIVKCLLSAGANVHCRSIKDDQTAFTISLYENNMEISKLLFNSEEKDNYFQSIFTPLHIALQNENIEAIKFLLAQGVDVKKPTKDGLPSIAMAAAFKNADSLTLLYEHGADVNASCPDGRTALLLAIFKQNIAAVKRLIIGLGASLEKVKFSSHCLEINDRDLNHPVIQKIKNHGEITPLEAAEFVGNKEIYQIIANQIKLSQVQPKVEEKKSETDILKSKIENWLKDTGIEVDVKADDKNPKKVCIKITSTSNRTLQVLVQKLNGTKQYNGKLVVESERSSHERSSHKVEIKNTMNILNDFFGKTIVIDTFADFRKTLSNQPATKQKSKPKAAEAIAPIRMNMPKELNAEQVECWRKSLLPAFCFAVAEENIIWNKEEKCFIVNAFVANSENEKNAAVNWSFREIASDDKPLQVTLSKEAFKNMAVSYLAKKLEKTDPNPQLGKIKVDATGLIKIYPDELTITPLKEIAESMYKDFKPKEKEVTKNNAKDKEEEPLKSKTIIEAEKNLITLLVAINEHEKIPDFAITENNNKLQLISKKTDYFKEITQALEEANLKKIFTFNLDQTITLDLKALHDENFKNKCDKAKIYFLHEKIKKLFLMIIDKEKFPSFNISHVKKNRWLIEYSKNQVKIDHGYVAAETLYNCVGEALEKAGLKEMLITYGDKKMISAAFSLTDESFCKKIAEAKTNFETLIKDKIIVPTVSEEESIYQSLLVKMQDPNPKTQLKMAHLFEHANEMKALIETNYDSENDEYYRVVYLLHLVRFLTGLARISIMGNLSSIFREGRDAIRHVAEVIPDWREFHERQFKGILDIFLTLQNKVKEQSEIDLEQLRKDFNYLTNFLNGRLRSTRVELIKQYKTKLEKLEQCGLSPIHKKQAYIMLCCMIYELDKRHHQEFENAYVDIGHRIDDLFSTFYEKIYNDLKNQVNMTATEKPLVAAKPMNANAKSFEPKSLAVKTTEDPIKMNPQAKSFKPQSAASLQLFSVNNQQLKNDGTSDSAVFNSTSIQPSQK